MPGALARREIHLADCDAVPELPLRLRALFVEHAAFVSRSLRWLGVRRSELGDALKQVFSIAYHEPTGRKQREHARAWLYSICARVARSQQSRQSSLSPEVFEDTPGRQLLNELPAREREVFVLYEVEDMPLSEVAEALGCSIRRVRSSLRAARERVLAEVERMAAECDDD